MENVDSVEIEVTAMSKKDRSSVMEKARKKARDNAPETKIDPQTRVIAIGSGKGGVGKSTISTNIALGLEKQGYKTGLLDADIWGFSIPRLLGIKARLEADDDKNIIPYKKGNLEVVSTGLITKALEQFLSDVSWSKLDYLIIDLPPGTGDIQMALGRLLPQAELIVVTTPQVTAQKVATRVADMAKRSFIPLLGVIENMSYFETNSGEKYEIFGEGGGEKLAEQFAIPLLMKIPLSEDTTTEADKGIPLIQQEKDTPTKSSLNELVDKITSALPPIIDETCTGRIAKVFEELSK
jgi:ATP-binding protein involved in chromosome partitioning